ncbi:MAG: transcriptional repressor, partial [Gammaproteobacteria bacterium]
RAEAHCRARGSNLTPLRRRVLELVIARGRPVGAYELLSELQAEGHGGSPPTVYRALEFLAGEGLVHRLEGSNSWLACPDPGHAHAGVVMCCRQCGRALEVDDASLVEPLLQRLQAWGFQPEQGMLEIPGTCRWCRENGSGHGR